MDDEPPSTCDIFDFNAETPCFSAVSWNVNSVRARSDVLESLLKDVSPDVVCLQEIKVQNDDFPFLELASAGYAACVCGQKSYNGVAVLSKQKARIVRDVLPASPDNGAQARFLDVALPNGLRVISVYVPNGEPSPKDETPTQRLTYKIGWLNALADYVGALAVRGEKFILAGDFNVIDTPLDVYDYEKFKDTVFMRPEVRGAFRRFAFAGLTDAVRLYAPENVPLYSFWDYKDAAFAKNDGLLLDYAFISPALSGALRGAEIMTAYRQADKPSDHAPIRCVFNIKP